MHCQVSRIKVIGFLGLTLLTEGASYLLTTFSEWIPRVIGWTGVAFFSLGLVAFPIAFFQRGPQVIIDDVGIEARVWKIGVIPWDEIRSLQNDEDADH